MKLRQTHDGVGPVLSYYEFKHPMSNRLTDEAWKDILARGQAPDRPDLVSGFYAEQSRS